MSAPPAWLAADGTPIACREKLAVLEENALELRQAMQNAFEDAVLIGVDAAAMRAWMVAEIAALASPRR